MTQFVSDEAPHSIVLWALVRRSDDGRFHVRLPGDTHQPFTDLHPVQIMDLLKRGKMRVVVQGGPPCELEPDTDISHSDDVWEFDVRRTAGGAA